MRYRKFGRTGMDVSDVAHGLWGMSGWKDSEDLQSVESLQLSADLGCDFYDTAWAYGEGKSDGFLGDLLQANPKKRLHHASKVPPMNRRWPALAEYPLGETFPKDYVLDMAEQIRRKLRVETIDLLQYHVWDDSWTDEPDFRDAVEKLKRDGVIRHFGLSLNRWEPWNGLRAIKT